MIHPFKKRQGQKIPLAKKHVRHTIILLYIALNFMMSIDAQLNTDKKVYIVYLSCGVHLVFNRTQTKVLQDELYNNDVQMMFYR